MTSRTERIVIASRGSRLALRQADTVAELLRRAHPGLDVAIETVTTTGDRDQRPYSQIGGKGLFTSEVERALLEERADVAVHSAKDLTAELAEGCALICVPPRASVHDVVVGGRGSTGAERLGALAPGARVGTSSMRRRSLLAEIRPDVDAVELRGNLDTRLAKVEEGVVDVAILAAAGIERLGVDVGAAPLDPEAWVPAPAQGALAVEAPAGRSDMIELFAPLNDPVAAAEVTCERAFAATLEGGCSVPLGCLARGAPESRRLVVSGFLGWVDGTQAFRDRISGGIEEAESLGKELGRALLSAGADDVIAELKGEALPAVEEP